MNALFRFLIVPLNSVYIYIVTRQQHLIEPQARLRIVIHLHCHININIKVARHKIYKENDR